MPLTMYKLLIWLLLAFVPLTGMRMVCIERPAESERSATGAGDDCDQFCLRSSAHGRDTRSADVECMLLAECSLLAAVSSVAILPQQVTVRFELAQRPYVSEVLDDYLAPVLPHHTPPPKA